jgi:hypothetical protein
MGSGVAGPSRPSGYESVKGGVARRELVFATPPVGYELEVIHRKSIRIHWRRTSYTHSGLEDSGHCNCTRHILET